MKFELHMSEKSFNKTCYCLQFIESILPIRLSQSTIKLISAKQSQGIFYYIILVCLPVNNPDSR